MCTPDGLAMPGLAAGLTSFMASYEQAANSHDIDRVAPLIAEDATYWFSDGSHQGIAAVTAAIERTFASIRDEIYQIRELEWVVLAPDTAVCRYHFRWEGVVDGKPRSGRGRGTNVIARRDGAWKMLHEHLSS
jgi:ketosteroid isomerase-like protein